MRFANGEAAPLLQHNGSREARAPPRPGRDAPALPARQQQPPAGGPRAPAEQPQPEARPALGPQRQQQQQPQQPQLQQQPPPRPQQQQPQLQPPQPQMQLAPFDEDIFVAPLGLDDDENDVQAPMAQQQLFSDAQVHLPGCDFTYTAKPPGGWPRRHRDDPNAPVVWLAKSKLRDWYNPQKTDPRCAALLELHCGGVPAPDRVGNVTQRLIQSVAGIVGHDAFKLVPPHVDMEAPRHGDLASRSPSAWLVSGLQPEQIDMMVDQGTYSIRGGPALTFHVSRIGLPIPTFLCQLGGYATPDAGGILESVREAFAADYIWLATKALVQEDLGLDDPAAVDPAAQRIVDSVSVRVSQDEVTGEVRAAVFCRSPTRDTLKWRGWKQLVCSRPFDSSTNSPGIPLRAAICKGCKGADHDKSWCPYESVPGWNGPGTTSNVSYDGSRDDQATPGYGMGGGGWNTHGGNGGQARGWGRGTRGGPRGRGGRGGQYGDRGIGTRGDMRGRGLNRGF